MNDSELPQLFEIEAAAARLVSRGVTNTPLIQLHERGPLRVFAKLECLQPGARCYKARGAFNVLAEMQESDPGLFSALRGRGIATASAGNFAIALGHAAHRLDLPLTVLVPHGVSAVKLAMLRRIAPATKICQVSAEAWWQSMLQERVLGLDPAEEGLAPDALFISPARNMAVMAANGTIGLEILEQLPRDPRRALHVLIPYGGGGLCIGVAAALKQRARGGSRRCSVYACEVTTGAPFGASLAAGMPVTVKHEKSFVDGIGASAVLPDNFERARQVLDGALAVTPEQIMLSCLELLERHGLVVEGAGAASLAAAAEHYTGTDIREPTDVVCVLSGGNIELSALLEGVDGAR